MQEKGEALTNDRKSIEEAAGQVCRGVNGLVSLFAQHPPLRQQQGTVAVRLMAAIFTTANLFVTDADLGRSRS